VGLVVATAIDPAGNGVAVWPSRAADGSPNESLQAAILDAGGPMLHALRLLAAPTISGTPRVGRALTCAPGRWSGATPIGFAYRWLRESRRIGTSSKYRVRRGDGGHRLACRVTATNEFGSITAMSRAVRVRR
jgi:hypothetical protein